MKADKLKTTAHFGGAALRTAFVVLATIAGLFIALVVGLAKAAGQIKR